MEGGKEGACSGMSKRQEGGRLVRVALGVEEGGRGTGNREGGGGKVTDSKLLSGHRGFLSFPVGW